jgi:hypothetical protein
VVPAERGREVPPVSRPRCTATTAKGEQCRNPAMEGSDRCVSHVGPVGRKTLLTSEVAEQLVAMLRAGNYLNVALRAVSVSRQTFHDWMRRGRSDEPSDVEFRLLRDRVQQARAQGEARAVAAIAQAATSSWQAAAWLLERQYPERWGRVSVRYRDDDGPPVPEVSAGPENDDPFSEVDELAEARRRRGA